MSHLVIVEREPGTEVLHRAADLAEAVRYVEELRNEEGLAEARIFELTEVGFEFKQYFRVQLEDGNERSEIDLRRDEKANRDDPADGPETSGFGANPTRRGLFSR